MGNLQPAGRIRSADRIRPADRFEPVREDPGQKNNFFFFQLKVLAGRRYANLVCVLAICEFLTTVLIWRTQKNDKVVKIIL